MNDIKYKNEKFNFAYRVSAIIYNEDETKMLLFYGDDMDFYMLPGGKVKEQENSVNAIKREIPDRDFDENSETCSFSSKIEYSKDKSSVFIYS